MSTDVYHPVLAIDVQVLDSDILVHPLSISSFSIAVFVLVHLSVHLQRVLGWTSSPLRLRLLPAPFAIVVVIVAHLSHGSSLLKPILPNPPQPNPVVV
ncbi:hypothetical protein F5Y03DRAFT_401521 [Xylaria venustula]|nr:hypothetical protein F5Y03DRAFT_401521 [Xylaria venustula]